MESVSEINLNLKIDEMAKLEPEAFGMSEDMGNKAEI